MGQTSQARPKHMKLFNSLQDEQAWVRSQVRSAQRGNETAYLELVELVQPRLFSFALCLTGHYEEAGRLLTETFVLGLRNLSWLTIETEPFEWFLRLLSQEFERGLSAQPEVIEARPVVDDTETQAFFGALMQLTPRERQVLLMIDSEGLSLELAAEVGGRSVREVCYLLEQARSQFLTVYEYKLALFGGAGPILENSHDR